MAHLYNCVQNLKYIIMMVYSPVVYILVQVQVYSGLPASGGLLLSREDPLQVQPRIILRRSERYCLQHNRFTERVWFFLVSSKFFHSLGKLSGIINFCFLCFRFWGSPSQPQWPGERGADKNRARNQWPSFSRHLCVVGGVCGTRLRYEVTATETVVPQLPHNYDSPRVKLDF